MNWIDYTLIAILGFAAVRGFMKGFVLELCGLIGFVLGIWGAIHFNSLVARWFGLEEQHEAVSFLITVLLILVALHFIGVALTKALDAVQLSLPNKLGGTLLGTLRAAFLLSVLLNILFAKHDSGWTPPLETLRSSALVSPLRAFAPAIVPALGETKWVLKAIGDLKQGIGE